MIRIENMKSKNSAEPFFIGKAFEAMRHQVSKINVDPKQRRSEGYTAIDKNILIFSKRVQGIATISCIFLQKIKHYFLTYIRGLW